MYELGTLLKAALPMQAVFFVDVTYPAGLVALANTEPLPLTTARGGGLQKQWHAPTPVMSPYLLAICIGRLVSKHAHTGELILLKRNHNTHKSMRSWMESGHKGLYHTV